MSANLNGVLVYPNLAHRQTCGPSHAITFDGVTIGTTIKIFTIAAHAVKTLQTDGPRVTWDLKNDAGDPVASGVYVYLITDAAGDKLRGKVAVIK